MSSAAIRDFDAGASAAIWDRGMGGDAFVKRRLGVAKRQSTLPCQSFLVRGTASTGKRLWEDANDPPLSGGGRLGHSTAACLTSYPT
eukprot:9873797-Alexandrium_andersonii.AAC.1